MKLNRKPLDRPCREQVESPLSEGTVVQVRTVSLWAVRAFSDRLKKNTPRANAVHTVLSFSLPLCGPPLCGPGLPRAHSKHSVLRAPLGSRRYNHYHTTLYTL
jgi:hypothetical protein